MVQNSFNNCFGYASFRLVVPNLFGYMDHQQQQQQHKGWGIILHMQPNSHHAQTKLHVLTYLLHDLYHPRVGGPLL